MENKIKLYDELKLRFSNHKLNDKFDLDSHQFSSHDMIEFAGAIGIKLLELAAKNAENEIEYDMEGNFICYGIVNKQSILDTIKQII